MISLLFIAGCAGEPYTYVPENELKPGPGLFSGKDGEIRLLSEKQQDEKEQAIE